MDFTGVTYGFDIPIMKVLQGSGSLFLDNFVMTLTAPSTWIPLYAALLVLVIRNNEVMKQIVLVCLFAIISVAIIDSVIDMFVKPYFMRWRPTRDPLLKYSIDVVNNNRSGRFGFFSAHAANTMSVAVFFCLVVRSRLLNATLFSYSLLNCYTRVYLGVHFPSDILVGMVAGSLMAALSYAAYRLIERRVSVRARYISSHYTSTGYAYRDIYVVAAVFQLTLFYAMIMALF